VTPPKHGSIVSGDVDFLNVHGNWRSRNNQNTVRRNS